MKAYSEQGLHTIKDPQLCYEQGGIWVKSYNTKSGKHVEGYCKQPLYHRRYV